jgi:hypothetical protein
MVAPRRENFEDIPLIIPAVVAMSRKKPAAGRRGREIMIE